MPQRRRKRRGGRNDSDDNIVIDDDIERHEDAHDNTKTDEIETYMISEMETLDKAFSKCAIYIYHVKIQDFINYMMILSHL